MMQSGARSGEGETRDWRGPGGPRTEETANLGLRKKLPRLGLFGGRW